MSSSFQSTQVSNPVPASVANVSCPDSGKLVFSVNRQGVQQGSVEVTERTATIGSADDCTISLCGDDIQPQSLRITRGRQRTFVNALCPETQLNGKTFTRDWLKEGDQISCGPFDLQVVCVEPFKTDEPGTEPADAATAKERSVGSREEELRKLKEHTTALRAKLEQQRQQLLEGNVEVETDLRESLEQLRKSREQLVAMVTEARSTSKKPEVETSPAPKQVTPVTCESLPVAQPCEPAIESTTSCCHGDDDLSPCEQSVTEDSEVEYYNLLLEDPSAEVEPSRTDDDVSADEADCEASPLLECEVIDVEVDHESESLKEWFNTEAEAQTPEDLLASLKEKTVVEETAAEQHFDADEAFEALVSSTGAVDIAETEDTEPEIDSVVEATADETVLSAETDAEITNPAAATETQDAVAADVENTEFMDAETHAIEPEFAAVEETPVEPPKSTLPQHVLDIIRTHQQELASPEYQNTTTNVEAAEDTQPVSVAGETPETVVEIAIESLDVPAVQDVELNNIVSDDEDSDELDVEQLLMDVMRERDTSESNVDEVKECAGETFFSHIASEDDEAEEKNSPRMQLPTFSSIRSGLTSFFGNTNQKVDADAGKVQEETVPQAEMTVQEELTVQEEPEVQQEPSVHQQPEVQEPSVLQPEEPVLEEVPSQETEQGQPASDVQIDEAPEQVPVELSRIEQRLSEHRNSLTQLPETESPETESPETESPETECREAARPEAAVTEIEAEAELAELVHENTDFIDSESRNYHDLEENEREANDREEAVDEEKTLEATVSTDSECETSVCDVESVCDTVEFDVQASETEPELVTESAPASPTYEQIKQSMLELENSGTGTELPGSATETAQLQSPAESPAAESGAGKELEEEQEDTVEAYMERLLNRSGAASGRQNPKKSAPAPSKVEKQVEVEVKNVLKETFSDQLATRQEELKPVEISPQSLPELETNYLDDMRNMSRESAKSAIEASFRRKTSTAAAVQLGLALCCLLGGLIQTVLSKGFTTFSAMMAIPFYLVAVVLFYRYNSWRRTCHKVGGTGAIKGKSKSDKETDNGEEK